MWTSVGGVLHAPQRAVDLERRRDVLRALGSEFVPTKTAREGGLGVSAAADTFVSVTSMGGKWAVRMRLSTRGVLECLEGLVLLEARSEVLGGLGVEVVEAQTANKGEIAVSAAADTFRVGYVRVLAADSRETCGWRRT